MINVQEIVRSPSPIQHKVETPFTKMNSCLEAYLAGPTHYSFLGAKQGFTMHQASGTHDPF